MYNYNKLVISLNDFVGSGGGGGCAKTHPTQTYGNRESTDGQTAAATASRE